MSGIRRVETMKVIRASWLLLLAFVLSSGVALAQDTPAVGIMAGVNQSYFAVSPAGDTSAKQGFLIGAFAVLRRDKAIKIQPEIQLSQRRIGVTYAGVDTTYSTSYLNVSSLVRLKLFKSLYTTQGPQFSFPVRASLKVPGGTGDVKSNIANDFSLIVGLGGQMGRFGIEGRWDSGMKRVEEIPLGGFVKRNRAITFMGIIGF